MTILSKLSISSPPPLRANSYKWRKIEEPSSQLILASGFGCRFLYIKSRRHQQLETECPVYNCVKGLSILYFPDCKAQVSILITYDCCYPDSLTEAKLSAKTTSYTFKLHLSDSLFLLAFAKKVFNKKDVLHLLPLFVLKCNFTVLSCLKNTNRISIQGIIAINIPEMFQRSLGLKYTNSTPFPSQFFTRLKVTSNRTE